MMVSSYDVSLLPREQSHTMTDNELTYLLALSHITNIGPVRVAALIEAFGSLKNVFRASVDDIVSRSGVPRKVASSIVRFNDWKTVEDNKEEARKSGIVFVTPDDEQYPPLLRNIYDYPPLLFVKGSLSAHDVPVAVVGSRSASTYGKFITERISRELSCLGVTIVSGMARGIDTAAHRGALSGHGKTVAVMGTGIDIIYPPENRSLHTTIAESGAIVTEFPFGTQPLAPHFPLRNRIISGMSFGVVVVEAHERSGSLITARLAGEQGREVFAIPGTIDSPGSRGTHWLIKNGAKLVESVDDILEEIAPQITAVNQRLTVGTQPAGCPEPIPTLTDVENHLLKEVGELPVHIDTLIAKTGREAHQVVSTLMTLEINGYIEQQPGKFYRRKI